MSSTNHSTNHSTSEILTTVEGREAMIPVQQYNRSVVDKQSRKAHMRIYERRCIASCKRADLPVSCA